MRLPRPRRRRHRTANAAETQHEDVPIVTQQPAPTAPFQTAIGDDSSVEKLPQRPVSPLFRFPTLRLKPQTASRPATPVSSMSSHHSNHSSIPSLANLSRFLQRRRRLSSSKSTPNQSNDVIPDVPHPQNDCSPMAAVADPVRRASIAGLNTVTPVEYAAGDAILTANFQFSVPPAFTAAHVVDGVYLFHSTCLAFIQALPAGDAIEALLDTSHLSLMNHVSVRTSPVWRAEAEAAVEYVMYGGCGNGFAAFNEQLKGAVVVKIAGPMPLAGLMKEACEELRKSIRLLQTPQPKTSTQSLTTDHKAANGYFSSCIMQ